MFTGIVEGMGIVARLVRRGGAIRLEVKAPGETTEDLKIGDSVAVNGACVTVTDIEGSTFAADLVPETLGRTNLGTLQTGEEVNLERPLRANARLDGHVVQGHVDVVGLVRSRRRVGAQELLEVNVPFELTRYLAPKGSVSVDGVSLTVVDVNKDRFRVALIPHTIATTTLGKKIQGQAVNVEVDILSKYVERHIAARIPQRPPSISSLVAAQDAENSRSEDLPVTITAPKPVPAAIPPVSRSVATTPRSQPAPRPAPPPRQQPPRFKAAPQPKERFTRSASPAKKPTAKAGKRAAQAGRAKVKSHASRTARRAAPKSARGTASKKKH
ncbi:MAG: riboflavin synthase [Actinomycetota bacterium]